MSFWASNVRLGIQEDQQRLVPYASIWGLHQGLDISCDGGRSPPYAALLVTGRAGCARHFQDNIEL